MSQIVDWGYRPDPVGVVAPSVRDLVVGSTPATAVSLAPYVERVRQQRHYSACVGCAFAAGIEIRGRVLGTMPASLSETAIWTYARSAGMLHTHGRMLPLANTGCTPSDAVEGMRTWGLVHADRWPLGDDTACSLVPWDVVQGGYDMRFDQAYRLGFETRIQELRDSLVAGYPVAFAAKVCAGFLNWRAGSAYDGAVGADKGWHMMLAVGFDGDNVRVLNSWGEDWCDAGFCWITSRYLASEFAQDFYAIKASVAG